MIGYEVIKVERDVDMHRIYDRVRENKRVYRIFSDKEKAKKFIKDNWHPEYYYELGNKVMID